MTELKFPITDERNTLKAQWALCYAGEHPIEPLVMDTNL